MSTRTLATKLAFITASVVLAACGPGVDQAEKVSLSQVPAQIVAGQPLGLTATIQTGQGQVVEAYEGDVTVSIVQGPDLSALSGTTTVKAVKGVATFTDLTLIKVGAGYVLRVKPGNVPGGRSISEASTGAITVNAGPPAGISMITQPGRSGPGGVIYPFPRVAVADAYGNVITGQAADITVSLGNNPGGSTLSGTTTHATVNGVAEFADLSLNNLGTGYTLTFNGGSAGTVTSVPFDVVQPRLTYVDPTVGRVRLVKAASGSTDTSVLLEFKVFEAFTGYSAGFNIPTDTRVVTLGTPGIVAGSGLDPGSAPAAIGAALRTTGKMANVLTAGVSQKASGGGAVATDSAVAAGTVLFTVKLDMVAIPLFKPAFDGTSPIAGLEGAVRNREGNDVVTGLTFGIGRLAVE